MGNGVLYLFTIIFFATNKITIQSKVFQSLTDTAQNIIYLEFKIINITLFTKYQESPICSVLLNYRFFAFLFQTVLLDMI